MEISPCPKCHSLMTTTITKGELVRQIRTSNISFTGNTSKTQYVELATKFLQNAPEMVKALANMFEKYFVYLAEVERTKRDSDKVFIICRNPNCREITRL